MTPDEQTILRLTRENDQMQLRLVEAVQSLTRIGIHCSRAGMPNGFEDGNSYDDYSDSERVGLLADAYLRLKNQS